MEKYIYLDSNFNELPSSIEKRIVCDKNKCNHCCYNDNFIMYLFDKKAIKAIFEKVKAKDYNKVSAPEKGVLRPCPVLDVATGKCTIYEDRPMPCRTYHSTSEQGCITLKNDNIVKAEHDVEEDDLSHQVLKLTPEMIAQTLPNYDKMIKRDAVVVLAESFLAKTDLDGEFETYYDGLCEFVNNPIYKIMSNKFFTS